MTSKQRAYLKSLAMKMDPIMQLGKGSVTPENTVSVHIRRIREKIEINPKEPKYLKVVWGIGYKIEKI